MRIVFRSTLGSVGGEILAGLALTLAMNTILSKWAQGNQPRYRRRQLGEWSVFLPPEAAGGPYQPTMVSNKIVLDDVLIGDVWFASGQSNMEMLERLPGRPSERLRRGNRPRRPAADQAAVHPA